MRRLWVVRIMDSAIDGFEQISLADDRGQIAVVVELCQKHLTKHPRDGFSWLLYGMSQISLARYAEAEKAIRKGIKFCPAKARPIAYSKMGHLFKAKGDFNKAAFWYRKAIRNKPNHAGYHIFAGSNAYDRGWLRQAETHYRRALKCTEGSLDEAFFNLGGILLGRRKYSEAIECYREALKIDPKYQIAKKRLDDAELAFLMANS
jgi:tetratricopeptide (TPR) repeat protein